jgi:HTH-type transcriptional regulator/antitoxin HigA
MNSKQTLVPLFSTHPGELILDEMKVRKITQLAMANQIGVHPSFLNEVIKGKRSIHAHLAIALENALGISAEYWLRLQMQYDLSKARAELKQKNQPSADPN